VGSAVEVAHIEENEGENCFCSRPARAPPELLSRWGKGRQKFRKGIFYYIIMVFIFEIAEISTLLP
jgi:hypothetical protein